jgi:hypothetical protein
VPGAGFALLTGGVMARELDPGARREWWWEGNFDGRNGETTFGVKL